MGSFTLLAPAHREEEVQHSFVVSVKKLFRGGRLKGQQCSASPPAR